MAADGAFGPELVGRACELTYWHLTGGFVPGEVTSLFKQDADAIGDGRRHRADRAGRAGDGVRRPGAALSVAAASRARRRASPTTPSSPGWPSGRRWRRGSERDPAAPPPPAPPTGSARRPTRGLRLRRRLRRVGQDQAADRPAAAADAGGRGPGPHPVPDLHQGGRGGDGAAAADASWANGSRCRRRAAGGAEDARHHAGPRTAGPRPRPVRPRAGPARRHADRHHPRLLPVAAAPLPAGGGARPAFPPAGGRGRPCRAARRARGRHGGGGPVGARHHRRAGERRPGSASWWPTCGRRRRRCARCCAARPGPAAAAATRGRRVGRRCGAGARRRWSGRTPPCATPSASCRRNGSASERELAERMADWLGLPPDLRAEHWERGCAAAHQGRQAAQGRRVLQEQAGPSPSRRSPPPASPRPSAPPPWRTAAAP